MKAEAKSFKHFGVVKFEAHVCTYAAVPGETPKNVDLSK